MNPASAIVVLNAGSSSIKFMLFAEREEALDPVVRGQIDGLLTAPRFPPHPGGILTMTGLPWSRYHTVC